MFELNCLLLLLISSSFALLMFSFIKTTSGSLVQFRVEFRLLIPMCAEEEPRREMYLNNIQKQSVNIFVGRFLYLKKALLCLFVQRFSLVVSQKDFMLRTRFPNSLHNVDSQLFIVCWDNRLCVSWKNAFYPNKRSLL